MVSLTPRFEQAVAYAVRLHEGQVRKGTAIPYAAHLLSVSALVLEDGGHEEEAIAALLHDAVEDRGGMERYEEIRRMFGQRVARIVLACSDSDVSDPAQKPPWRERKERYLAALPHKEPDEVRVLLADKLHNARAILSDLRDGADVWSRFNAGRDEQLWYYRSLADAFSRLTDSPLAGELDRVVSRIEELAAPEG